MAHIVHDIIYDKIGRWARDGRVLSSRAHVLLFTESTRKCQTVIVWQPHGVGKLDECSSEQRSRGQNI